MLFWHSINRLKIVIIALFIASVFIALCRPNQWRRQSYEVGEGNEGDMRDFQRSKEAVPLLED